MANIGAPKPLKRNNRRPRRGGHLLARPRRRRAFTLLEILAVVAIVAILAAVLLSAFHRSRNMAHRAKCDVNLKSIALALDAFKQEHGYFPTTLAQLETDKYITDHSVMSCPDDPRSDPSYEDFYAIRSPQDSNELPILVCPFHDDSPQGVQAYIGRFTTQFRASPAQLTTAVAATVQHPGQDPVAAPVGLVLHGADRIVTGAGGSATIVYSDGSEADIGHDSDVTVMQSFVQGQTQGVLYTLMHQSVGTVLYRIHHGSKFDVVTPTATAGALGTEFEIRVNATDGTWIQGHTGKVRLNTLASVEPEITNEYWYQVPPPPPPVPPGQPPLGPPPRPKRPPGPPPPP